MSSHDDIEPEADRAIDELLDAANEEAESDPIIRPPFAAVLGRARRLDPTLTLPARDVTGAHGVPTDDATLRAQLEPFVAAARAEAEHDVAVQRSQGYPGLPRRSGGIARWVVVGGTLAAAAVVLVLLGLLDVRNALRADAQLEINHAVDQAHVDRPVREAATGGEEPLGSSRPRYGRASIPQRKAVAPDHILPEEPVPLEDIAPEPTEMIPQEPAPLEAPTVKAPALDAGTERPTASRSSTRRSTRRQRSLQRLDDLAATRLAAGDTTGAQKAYRALIRKAGRSGLAELAYGDLFTLAHGQRDRAEQRRLWREYLDKFPRGRFADDARAGLCRGLAGEPRAECWERYLDDFPTGAYHRQAERALSRE
ncbi:MAG: hypothetical protein AAGF11_24395 [Myxococcota bacterium]